MLHEWSGVPINQPLGSYWHLLGGAGVYIYIILAPINGLKYIGNWGEMTLKTFGHGYIGGYSVKLATRPHEFELCRIHGGIREPILLYLFWFGGLCGKCIYIFIYIYRRGIWMYMG